MLLKVKLFFKRRSLYFWKGSESCNLQNGHFYQIVSILVRGFRQGIRYISIFFILCANHSQSCDKSKYTTGVLIYLKEKLSQYI